MSGAIMSISKRVEKDPTDFFVLAELLRWDFNTHGFVVFLVCVYCLDLGVQTRYVAFTSRFSKVYLCSREDIPLPIA